MKLKKKGKVYHAQFKTRDGSIKSVTTRATELSEARRIAKEAGIEQLEHAARAGRLTQEVIGKIMTGGKLTMEKAVAEFAEWQRSVGKSERTIENNGMWYRAWFEWDKAVKSTPPSAITERHINKFVNREDIAAGAASRKVVLAACRNLFDFCAAKGWTVGNPAALVAVNYDLLSHDQKEPETLVPFTPEEYRRLVKHLRGEIDECEKEIERLRAPHRTLENTPHLAENVNRLENRRFWLAATHLDWETGLRIGDVAEIEWDSFKIPSKVIVWTGKRNKRVAIPISDELATLITEIPLMSNKYLFPDQRQTHRDPKKRAKLSVQFARICVAAGIEDKSFHNLRHAHATRLKKMGKTLEEIGEVLGHSSTKTTARYVH